MKYLVISLIFSLASNLLLGWLWLGQRDTLTVANGALKASQAKNQDFSLLASACSSGVDYLRELADKRVLAAKGIREQVESEAKIHDRAADVALSSEPQYAGDACKSAEALSKQWLKSR